MVEPLRVPRDFLGELPGVADWTMEPLGHRILGIPVRVRELPLGVSARLVSVTDCVEIVNAGRLSPEEE